MATSLDVARPPGRGGGRWSAIAAGLAALAGFYALAAAYLRPIWQVWRFDLPPNEGDVVFNLYLLKWVGHEVRRGFAGFWDPPFFYPHHGVLAWSDHMLGPGLAAAAWNALVPGWVGAYNLLLLSSFALTGWVTSLVLRRSGRSRGAAVLGGVLYAFCPFRWDQLTHLQVLLMAAIPATLWCFDRLLARPSWPRAATFLACYAVHLSGGCYLAVMIHLPLLVLACNRAPEVWRRRRGLGGAAFAVWAVAGAVAAGLFAAIFFEYWHVGLRESLAWNAGAERQWGATLLSWLQPSRTNTYGRWWPRSLFRSENCLFPGFVAVGLCVAGAAFLWARRDRGDVHARRDRDDVQPARGPARWRRHLLLAAALLGWAGGEIVTWSDVPRFAALGRWVPGNNFRLPFALAAVGVALWALAWRLQEGRWPGAWIGALPRWPRGVLLAGAATALASTPLVFVPLAHVVPGLFAMRVPARFQAFTMFAVAFAAAAAIDLLAQRLRRGGGPVAGRRAVLLTAALLLTACIECAPRPLPWGPLPEEDDFPQVYAWLADQAEVHALLELPFEESTAAEPRDEESIEAMYYGTLHWHPLVNGYSAHFPLDYQQLVATCCHPMPETATLAALAARGVTHILIHRSDLPLADRRALDTWARANAGKVALVYAGGGDRVYHVLGP